MQIDRQINTKSSLHQKSPKSNQIGYKSPRIWSRLAQFNSKSAQMDSESDQIESGSAQTWPGSTKTGPESIHFLFDPIIKQLILEPRVPWVHRAGSSHF